MSLIIHQLTIHEKARRRKKGGREYLVAPIVAVVEGVMNNHLVTMNELGKSLSAWDGVPLVIEHPTRDGIHISANEEGVPHYGFLTAPVVNGKFKAEAWWDVALLQDAGETGEQIIHNLEHGHKMEGSTAYYQDAELQPGSHQGVAYHSIARNIQPDHYAVLLSGVGACSIQQGCGICANQAQRTGGMVAFFLGEEDAQALAAQIGELPAGSRLVSPAEMHVTLAYLGEVADLEADGKDQGRVLESLLNFSKHSTLVRGRLNGLARFLQVQEDGTQALVALVDSPMLERWRNGLLEVLEYGCDLRSAKNHAFTPHITLAYLPADAPTPAIPQMERDLAFGKLSLAWGGQVTAFDLQGQVVDISANTRIVHINEELSLDEQSSRVYNAWYTQYGHAAPGLPSLYIKEVFEDHVIVSGHPDGLLLYPYTTKDGVITFGEPTRVERVYQPIEGEVTANSTLATVKAALSAIIARAFKFNEAEKLPNEAGKPPYKETDMDKKLLIQQLVANERCPLKQPALEKLSPEELQTLADSLKEAPQTNAQAAPDPATSLDLKAIEAVVASAIAPLATKVDGIIANQKTAEDKEKTDLIADLVANEACPLPETALKKLDLNELRSLQAEFIPADYSGRGGLRTHAASGEAVPYDQWVKEQNGGK